MPRRGMRSRVDHRMESAAAVAPKPTLGTSSSLKKWALASSFLMTAGLVLIYVSNVKASRQAELGLLQEVDYDAETRRNSSAKWAFAETLDAYSRWDREVGCSRFRRVHKNLLMNTGRPAAFQDPESISCDKMKLKHVNVRVQSWTWIPDSLNNVYSCRCGLTCLWTKSAVLADQPDALFYEYNKPRAEERRDGSPLRVYMDLEPERKPAPVQEIFISYHKSSDVQSTYAGGLFHSTRSYYVSATKNKDVLVYWSSSRCLPARQEIATKFLSLISYHSFGKCLNNVGGGDAALTMYPSCRQPGQNSGWSQHLHCAMSHYKFALAIENTMSESYVTEKLFYALEAGTVPIYFGAPNVLDFVPPHSIIDGSQFNSTESLASYVKELAEDPVRYASYHAWRRCGVTGNYYWARALSLDTLPCRLCARVSSSGQ